MSTCKAGKNNDTPVNEKFILRGVENLRIGSGAVLPEIPYGNPHLTISAFSVALAFATLNIIEEPHVDMIDYYIEKRMPNDVLKIRRYPDIFPNVSKIAQMHRSSFQDKD